MEDPPELEWLKSLNWYGKIIEISGTNGSYRILWCHLTFFPMLLFPANKIKRWWCFHIFTYHRCTLWVIIVLLVNSPWFGSKLLDPFWACLDCADRDDQSFSQPGWPFPRKMTSKWETRWGLSTNQVVLPRFTRFVLPYKVDLGTKISQEQKSQWRGALLGKRNSSI